MIEIILRCGIHDSQNLDFIKSRLNKDFISKVIEKQAKTNRVFPWKPYVSTENFASNVP